MTNAGRPRDRAFASQGVDPRLHERHVRRVGDMAHDRGHLLEAAIRRHQGDAASVTRAYESLPTSDHEAINHFLKSLKAPREAKPANSRAQGIIAMAR